MTHSESAVTPPPTAPVRRRTRAKTRALAWLVAIVLSLAPLNSSAEPISSAATLANSLVGDQASGSATPAPDATQPAAQPAAQGSQEDFVALWTMLRTTCPRSVNFAIWHDDPAKRAISIQPTCLQRNPIDLRAASFPVTMDDGPSWVDRDQATTAVSDQVSEHFDDASYSVWLDPQQRTIHIAIYGMWHRFNVRATNRLKDALAAHRDTPDSPLHPWLGEKPQVTFPLSPHKLPSQEAQQDAGASPLTDPHGNSCTAAFLHHVGSTVSVSTAGHCLAGNAAALHQPTDHAVTTGLVKDATLAKDGLDLATWTVPAEHTSQLLADPAQSAHLTTKRPPVWPVPGATVTRAGKVTGRASGVITRTGVLVHSPHDGGGTWRDLTAVWHHGGRLSQVGDSGGPVTAHDHPIGVFWGAHDNTWFFTPVGHLQARGYGFVATATPS